MLNGENHWKKQVKKLTKRELEPVLHILTLLPNVGTGERKKVWNQLNYGRKRNLLFPFIESLTKKQEYSSLFFPAVVGKPSAPNFWLPTERSKPQPEEVWQAAYLLLSSIQFNDVLINLDNIGEHGRSEWRRLLGKGRGKVQLLGRIRSELQLHSGNWGTFTVALAAIAYFVHKKETDGSGRKAGGSLGKYINKLKEWGINDDTTLIVCQMGRREKHEIYYFGRLTPFIAKWFRSSVYGGNAPPLISFVDSLTTLSRRNKFVDKTREKLVFHLLNYGAINGETLAKLVEARVQDALDSKRYSTIKGAKQFFEML